MPPARLVPPDPPLTDGVVTLRPITPLDEPDVALLVDDPLVRRFTLIPEDAGPDFATGWVARYADGWADGARAGFAVEDAEGAFAGFAMLLGYAPERAEGELGYIVAPSARGAGVGQRVLRLLTTWCLETLGFERVELRIDAENAASLTMARRNGYVCEGTLRNTYLKGDTRVDLTIWSRLRTDPAS